MLDKAVITKLLTEGESISIEDYIEQCRVNASKTFHYFCKALVQQEENRSLLSSELRKYILSQVGSAYLRSGNKFNPEGWFGVEWTERLDGSDNEHFHDEFMEILERSTKQPYSYRIKTQYFEMVQAILRDSDIHQYQWDNELRQWIERSRNITNDLIAAYIQFFTLVFENTSCSERAWFGIHNNTASLVVGGIFLAAIIKSGKDKGIWLLLQDAPDIDGWQSWDTRSTQAASMPLKWFHTSLFGKVRDVLDNADIWQSYQIASARILDFPVVASDRDGVQEARKKVRLSTIYTSADNLLEEIRKYQFSYVDLQETERKAVIQSRIGQGRFRADLIQYWGECAVTGCEQLDVLRASHIKPWSKSSNEERLDKYNGLLLIPNLDVVFDAGYISFADDGSIIISSLLAEDDLLRLSIHSELNIDRLTEHHLKYLQYHRGHIFKGV